ncbi:multidrug effflux MFS transporter [Oceanibium sediminis]|uniref:multidrug effflux MFS transporter n=1 Tax=Oceanibium sediminis TaxID=2026339 RepID=UPI000DD2DCEA|nr:multidrug effflux MFS transporter [Oceanibium sediminis]
MARPDKRPLADQPLFILLLGGLSALTALSIDIMLPATGVIAEDLGAASEAGALLVGVYLLAYGAGQLFWGLFSDAYGRKPALVISLVGFLVVSVLCTLATDFWWLVALRGLQGLMGGAPVMARAIARDIGQGAAAARLFAVLMAVTSVAPLLAPIIGAALIELFGWRACFAFLALMAVALTVLTLRMITETVPSRRPERFSARFVATATRGLFAHRRFKAGLLISGLTFAGYASNLSLGAVVVEQAYGLGPASFAAIFAFGAAFVVAGSLAVRVVLNHRSLDWMIAAMIVVLGAAVLVNGAMWFATPPLPLFWGAVCLYFAAFGLGLPILQALAMEPARDIAGFASSILGAALMAFGGLGAALAMALYDGSHRAISGSMALCGLAAILCYVYYRPRSKPEEEERRA